jgi:hypothetical protein
MGRKNTKNLKNRNVVIFYVRKDFKPYFERFLELIEEDPIIKESVVKEDAGIMSIAISMQIMNYIISKDPGFIKKTQMGGVNDG